jgi:hypothetical protein
MFFLTPHKKPIGGYTHWDIHALARCLDPEAWAEFDALPEVNPVTGDKKYYGSFERVNVSFNMAINGLKNGVKIVSKHHLWSNKDLHNHILETEIKKLQHEKV